MIDVKVEGNAVWDMSANAISSSKNHYDRCLTQGPLPGFSLLVTDEDRERKAKTAKPGTYYVIMVPESFAVLPEYADVDSKASPGLKPVKPYSSMKNITTNQGCKAEDTNKNDDLNLVILKVFEDTSRHPPSTGKPSGASVSLEISEPLCSSPIPDSLRPSVAAGGDGSSLFDSRFEQQSQLSRDSAFAHFRHVVWRQLFPRHRALDGAFDIGKDHTVTLSADLFEREAARFPPLLHAIMAVSALSLSNNGVGKAIDALQYYHQVLPSLGTSLRSSDDLASDGVYLTHFLLLIYEVAAAQPHDSNLWSHHISHLLHISFLRRAKFGCEMLPLVLWKICHIDLFALLSGAGTGEFVRTIIGHQMLPRSDCLLYPTVREGYSMIYSDEHDSLLVIMRLYAEMFTITAQLAFLAAQLRSDRRSLPFSDFDQRPQDIYDLRRALNRLWDAADTVFYLQRQDSLPQRSRETLQQSAVMFHMSQLFSYSSMWPHQHAEVEYTSSTPKGQIEAEINHHASEILRIAEQTINSHYKSLHFLIFPLFLAGATASTDSLKATAMRLMAAMESENDWIGRNASTTRDILQVVYGRQKEWSMASDHPSDVDWLDVMALEGLQMVNFGF